MAELLFIATTIFVAYVVFEAVGKKMSTAAAADPVDAASAEPIPAAEPPAAPVKKSPPPAAAKPVSKAKNTTGKTKPKANPAPAEQKASASESDTLKNPKTGEQAKLPANYAFAKRWIKEALVEEGLLDKIYKNNELDPAATAKIQAALQQLKTMKKYQ